MQTFQTPGGELSVNFSDDHDFSPFSKREIGALKAAIGAIQTFSARRALSGDIEGSIDAVIDSGICMAPEFFVRSTMHTEIAERFLVKTTFGISLLESLEPHGIFSTVEKRSSPKFQRSRLIMVLASITMMQSGADHIESVPADVMLEIIKFFRTPDGLRWREGFLNSDQVASTCFREVTRALENTTTMKEYWRTHRSFG